MVYAKVDYRGYTPESFVEQRKEYLNWNSHIQLKESALAVLT